VVRPLLLLALCGCSAGLGSSDVSFRVHYPTTTPDGRDLDDAPPSVALSAGGKILPGGDGVGFCREPAQVASEAARETCRADAPAGTIATLACADDPHVDAFVCFYAVRAGGAVELWRHDGTFVAADGEPVKVTRGAMTRVGSLGVRGQSR
jgi:hypothetical protein